MPAVPAIVRSAGKSFLTVDGSPFIILGLQWDCDACFHPAEMNPLFPHAARMACNTAVLPVYWREVEPEMDHFDFRMVDERIKQCRANRLRLILLWFATWKNASPFYAPAYIREEMGTYQRALDRSGKRCVSHCPNGEATWQRDRNALVKLMEHLRQVDDEHTVIMIQIENEPGIMGSDRCYCPTCNNLYTRDGYEKEYGADAAEAFSCVSIARYIDRLAAEAKATKALPMYMNVWQAPWVGGVPGTYPSGGAVQHMLDVHLRQIKHLDFIAPDIYAASYRDFHRFCDRYAGPTNPLYVAEHSSHPAGRAERNVFYAVGEYGAIGFDPWAIDSPHPERDDVPFVNSVGGEWGPQAYWLRDSYLAISRAISPIVEAQGSDRIFTFVQEDSNEKGTAWAAPACDVHVTYLDKRGAARGIFIQRGADEFLAIGVGFTFRFARRRPDARAVPIASAEWGYFEQDSWRLLHPIRRQKLESEGVPVYVEEPGVTRVILTAEG